MSRKRKALKKVPVVDPKYKSSIVPKLINSIMYDGKKIAAEKIVYEAINKIKTKSKEEPITIFNDAFNNVRPTVEVRSRRVGGATYQVPVEVKSKRSQALALRWIVEASRKRKDKKCQISFLMKFMMLIKIKDLLLKKKKTLIKWQNQTKLLHILDGKKLCLELIH